MYVYLVNTQDFADLDLGEFMQTIDELVQEINVQKLEHKRTKRRSEGHPVSGARTKKPGAPTKKTGARTQKQQKNVPPQRYQTSKRKRTEDWGSRQENINKAKPSIQPQSPAVELSADLKQYSRENVQNKYEKYLSTYNKITKMRKKVARFGKKYAKKTEKQICDRATRHFTTLRIEQKIRDRCSQLELMKKAYTRYNQEREKESKPSKLCRSSGLMYVEFQLTEEKYMRYLLDNKLIDLEKEE